jgi:hypothetical protein
MSDNPIDKMVGRFLAWQLPKDFAPDGGISFQSKPDARGYVPSWPIGTNLLTADQARAMFLHCVGGANLRQLADMLDEAKQADTLRDAADALRT